jgi:hypothetical protein
MVSVQMADGRFKIVKRRFHGGSEGGESASGLLRLAQTQKGRSRQLLDSLLLLFLPFFRIYKRGRRNRRATPGIEYTPAAVWKLYSRGLAMFDVE